MCLQFLQMQQREMPNRFIFVHHQNQSSGPLAELWRDLSTLPQCLRRCGIERYEKYQPRRVPDWWARRYIIVFRLLWLSRFGQDCYIIEKHRSCRVFRTFRHSSLFSCIQKMKFWKFTVFNRIRSIEIWRHRSQWCKATVRKQFRTLMARELRRTFFRSNFGAFDAR